MHKADKSHGLMHRIHQTGFNALYRRSLIYNQCWEDPRLDRVALDLQPDSEVLVITSAGCNSLDYLLCEPRKVHCVDANPRQTALLELKLAGIKGLEWEDFFAIFGKGLHPNMRMLYAQKMRQHLSPASAAIWDKHLHWWSGRGFRRSFYDHGLSGLFARMVTAYMRARPGLYPALHRLLDAPTVDIQREIYHADVAPKLFSKPVKWALERQVTMNLLGVPYEQTRLTGEDHDEGIAGFIRDSVSYVACELPIQDNYFWRVYIEGSYTPECCPEYLKRENFDKLKDLVDRVSPNTTVLTDFLRTSGVSPSHLVLLDHMDWMGTSFPESLSEEWEQIFTKARPGARVIFRSGERYPAFLAFLQVWGHDLKDHLVFDEALAAELHPKDRVHTYAGFYIANLAPKRPAAEA